MANCLFFSKNINEKKRLTLRLCSILNSIYHGISYPWYFLPSEQSILVLYVCVNHLHMEMKLSSVQLLVNYMNKLYVILNWSAVGFIFEIGSGIYRWKLFTLMHRVKGDVPALCHFPRLKSDVNFLRSVFFYPVSGYSLHRFNHSPCFIFPYKVPGTVLGFKPSHSFAKM